MRNLSHQERCIMLNINPLLVTRHFQYKVKGFFEKIMLHDSLSKTKYYATQIEFQESSSPHVHSFICIFNTPNIQNENVYIEFIKKTICPVARPLE